MATDFEVFLRHDAPPAHVEAAVAALDRLEALEQRLTVYSPHSDLSQLNRQAAAGPVRLGADLLEIFKAADRLWRWTEGGFDVTAGPLVEAWGFTTRSGKRPAASEVEQALERVGWQHVAFDPEARTLAFTRPGMSINLGGIGKGYALDRIAASLRAAGVEDFLIHGGNSSVLAGGNDPIGADQVAGDESGGTESGGTESSGNGVEETEPEQRADSGAGWLIGLAHPLREGLRLGGVRLRQGALGTSGSGKQYFHYRGRRMGHVIDPRSGFPVDHFLALSVRTESAVIADGLATGLFVAGSERVSAFAAAQPEIAILASERLARAGEVSVRTWNLAAADWAKDGSP